MRVAWLGLLCGVTLMGACIATAPEGIHRQTDDGSGGELIDFPDASNPDSPTGTSNPDPHAVFGADPPHGPFIGGNRVLIAGKGFTTDVRVWFGETEALGVIPVNPTLVQVDAPAGPAGPVDLSAQNGSDASTRRTLPAGYSYDPLYAVPDSGPVAGGTVIQIYGQNTSWQSSTEARIDQQPCMTLTVVGPSELSCTVPPGTPGAKSIAVTTDSETLLASDAYRYEDTTDGYKGGLSGSPLAGTLTVFAFDNYTGVPLVGAHVVVGPGLTGGTLHAQADGDGRVELVDAMLQSPVTVSVAATCHSPISFVDVPVDTVVAYLDPVLTPQCAGEGDPPPSGGSPTTTGVVMGELVWEGGIEFKRAPWVNVPAPAGPDEVRVAYLFTTSRNAEQDWRFPAESYAVYPDASGDAGYEFNIPLYPGNHVLYALAGIRDDGATPRRFTAYAMGSVRGVGVEPYGTTAQVYISMMTPLDQALTMAVTPPPSGLKGPDRLHATVAIELAQFAYAIIPGAQKTPLLPMPSSLLFVGLPPLDGDLVGARYISGAKAVTGPSLSAPLSVIRQVATTSTGTTVDMTGFIAVPTLQTPAPGGPWDGRHLAVDYPFGGWPADLTVYEIASAGGLVRWVVAVPAADHAVELPDLSTLPDVELPSGPLVIGVFGAHIDGFDYGQLKYSNLRSSGMDAYALDYFNAHR